jgi:membrane protein required for colicin V production
MLTVFDYTVLAIVGFSVLLGFARGAVRELLALISWVIAFMVARLYAVPVSQMLPAPVGGETPRLFIAFICVFLVTLFVMGLLSLIISGLLKLVKLGFLDRGAGVVFGAGRGLAIVTVLVLASGLTALPREPFWREAVLSGPLEAFALYLKGWLPAEFARHIRYE